MRADCILVRHHNSPSDFSDVYFRLFTVPDEVDDVSLASIRFQMMRIFCWYFFMTSHYHEEALVGFRFQI